MTTISLRALSPAPTTIHLLDRAEHSGLAVRWLHPSHPRQAGYAHATGTIWLRRDLTDAEVRSLLAHELGHHHYGDHGPQPAHIETRAWQWAAKLLIPDCSYAITEITGSHHVPALAEELDVTAEVVHAYQSLLTRRCA